MDTFGYFWKRACFGYVWIRGILDTIGYPYFQGKTILDTDLFGSETSLPDVAWVVVVVVVVVVAVYLIPPSPYICL